MFDYPVGGRQTECRSTRQKDGVDPVDGVEVDFAAVLAFVEGMLT